MFEDSRAIARLPRTKNFRSKLDWINEAGSTSLDVRGFRRKPKNGVLFTGAPFFEICEWFD